MTPSKFSAWAVAALALTGCSSSAVTHPAQPPTAAQVAASQGYTRFTDCGPHPVGGVADSGTAYQGSERIGIDTFATTAVRDQWISTSASFGVIPLTEGGTWVSYKALSQSATGCG